MKLTTQELEVVRATTNKILGRQLAKGMDEPIGTPAPAPSIPTAAPKPVAAPAPAPAESVASPKPPVARTPPTIRPDAELATSIADLKNKGHFEAHLYDGAMSADKLAEMKGFARAESSTSMTSRQRMNENFLAVRDKAAQFMKEHSPHVKSDGETTLAKDYQRVINGEIEEFRVVTFVTCGTPCNHPELRPGDVMTLVPICGPDTIEVPKISSKGKVGTVKMKKCPPKGP